MNRLKKLKKQKLLRNTGGFHNQRRPWGPMWRPWSCNKAPIYQADPDGTARGIQRAWRLNDIQKQLRSFNELWTFPSKAVCRKGSRHVLDALHIQEAHEAAELRGWTWTAEYDDDCDFGDHAFWCPEARRWEARQKLLKQWDREDLPNDLRQSNCECDHSVHCLILRDASGRVLETLGGIIDAEDYQLRDMAADLIWEALATVDGPVRPQLSTYPTVTERIKAT